MNRGRNTEERGKDSKREKVRDRHGDRKKCEKETGVKESGREAR